MAIGVMEMMAVGTREQKSEYAPHLDPRQEFSRPCGDGGGGGGGRTKRWNCGRDGFTPAMR